MVEGNLNKHNYAFVVSSVLGAVFQTIFQQCLLRLSFDGPRCFDLSPTRPPDSQKIQQAYETQRSEIDGARTPQPRIDTTPITATTIHEPQRTDNARDNKKGLDLKIGSSGERINDDTVLWTLEPAHARWDVRAATREGWRNWCEPKWNHHTARRERRDEERRMRRGGSNAEQTKERRRKDERKGRTKRGQKREREREFEFEARLAGRLPAMWSPVLHKSKQQPPYTTRREREEGEEGGEKNRKRAQPTGKSERQ